MNSLKFLGGELRPVVGDDPGPCFRVQFRRAFSQLAEPDCKALAEEIFPNAPADSRNCARRRFGFRYENRRYSSLNAVAVAITGTCCNGLACFGLTSPAGGDRKEGSVKNNQPAPVRVTLESGNGGA